MIRLSMGGAVLAVALLTGWLSGDDKKPDKKPDDKDPPVVVVRGTLPTHYKRLGLSDEQKENVYKIRGRYKARIDALTKQIRDLQKEERTKLEEVLTEAQKTRLKELRAGETAQPAKDKADDKDKPEGKPPAKDKEPEKKP
jgi:hypothetical protein